jgi:thiopeptide-type bacteriocin biosynthesis protein
MELAESLFDIDSRFCGQFFTTFNDNNYTEQHWLVIFLIVKDYLFYQNEDENEQLRFAEIQLKFFLKEMNNKAIKIQIDQLFRKYGSILPTVAENYLPLLHQRRIDMEILLKGKQVSWTDNFLASLIHMLLNRYFINQQRLHECLLYGMIVKYLKAQILKTKNN